MFALNKNSLLKKHPNLKEQGLDFVEPFCDDNIRITAQAGLFSKISTKYSLEQWLTERNLESYLTKNVISDTCRLDALNELKLMNITAASIYPDLHGASMACNEMIENLFENIDFTQKMIELAKLLES